MSDRNRAYRNHPHWAGLPASSNQELSVDALLATTTAATATAWSQSSSFHPSQQSAHAAFVTSESSNLFYAPVEVAATLQSWLPGYAQPDLRQWDPYAHQNPVAESSHSLPVTPHQPGFSAPEHSHELSATWQPHQQYPQHTANNLVTSTVSTRQNSPSSTSSWPGLDSSQRPNATTALDLGPTMGQPWPLMHSNSDQEAYMHRSTSSDRFQRSPARLRGQQKLASQRRSIQVPSSFVERQEKVKVSKRKGPLADRQRERTHDMRKFKKVCVRCRFYKSGCDKGDPCEKCNKITGHARSFQEPCYRQHLEDTMLVRHCNGREQQEEAEFLVYDWIYNSQLHEMDILWNLPKYGHIAGAKPMRITYRHYNPKRGPIDRVASMWTNTNGDVQQPVQPAYAVYDTANLVPAFDRYFASLQPVIENWIFARIQRDQVALLTYHEAVRMRNQTKSKALSLAMRLQGLSIVSQGYGTVCSEQTPNIHEYDYRNLGTSHYEAYNRHSRERPLPGAITHQMDVAAIKSMAKLEKAFAKELAALIFKPRIKPWYELFLTFFVIFWNLEYIHQGAQSYITSKLGTPIQNPVSNVVTAQIKKWEFAFPVLLYHWRVVLRGFTPFKMARENPEELRERGHIDAQGFKYAVEIARLFSQPTPDQFQPPLTGFPANHWSKSSSWISSLFKAAGA